MAAAISSRPWPTFTTTAPPEPSRYRRPSVSHTTAPEARATLGRSRPATRRNTKEGTGPEVNEPRIMNAHRAPARVPADPRRARPARVRGHRRLRADRGLAAPRRPVHDRHHHHHRRVHGGASALAGGPPLHEPARAGRRVHPA